MKYEYAVVAETITDKNPEQIFAQLAQDLNTAGQEGMKLDRAFGYHPYGGGGQGYIVCILARPIETE